jgi:hypothetical protein
MKMPKNDYGPNHSLPIYIAMSEVIIGMDYTMIVTVAII